MRNKPLKAFVNKSPIRSVGSDVAGEAGKLAGKEVLKEGVKKIAGRVAAGAVGTAAATGGASYGLIKGYGNLAKQEHGKQIIKDARMMPGKI
jgi:hypothetical protein